MARLALILTLFLALLVPQAAMAQDKSAKGFVESLLEGMLASEGRSLSVENVSISLTGDVTVGHVAVSDGQGPWLTIDDLALDWKPLSLFGDQLEIDSLTMKQVHLLRMSQSTEGSVAAPQQMQNLRAALVKRLAIGQMLIDKPVLGQDAAIKLDGSGEITAAPMNIHINATASRLDGKKGELALRVDLDPATRKFDASANLSEAANGIISSLLSLRGEPSVDLSLKAAGDFSAWSGDFNLDIDGKRTIEGTASATPGTAGQTIAVNGTGAMSPLLPQSLENIFGGVSNLSVSALLPREGRAAEIDHLTLANDVLALNVSGVADWTGTRTNLEASLAAKNQQAVIPLPTTGLLGPVSVQGLSAAMRVTGELANPNWRLDLGWTSAASDRANINRMSASLEGHGLTPALSPVSFKGAVEAAIAEGGQASLPPAIVGPLHASLSGTWSNDDRLRIAGATLTAGQITLQSSGTLQPKTGTYDLTVAAQTASPETDIAALDRLLNGPVALKGRITGGGPQGMALHDATFTSPALSASAAGIASADALDLALDVTMLDLALLHSGMAGTAQLRAALAGPWQNLGAKLQGTGAGVTLLGKAFETPELSANLKFDGAAPSGDIAFSGTLAGKPVAIKANIDSDPNGATLLRDFTAAADGARMSGDLTWPKGGDPTGNLTFNAPDLTQVGPLFLSDIKGALSGTIELSGAGASHQTKVSFKGQNLTTGSLAAGHAEGTVTVTSLFHEPHPSGSIALASVRLGAQRFDMIDLNAEAISGNAFKTALTAAGRDLSADAAGTVTFAADGIQFTMSKLSGKAQGIAFAAASPVNIRQTGDTVAMDKATLNIGTGKVTLGGQLLPRLDTSVVLAGVPLSAFEKVAAAPGLRGTLSGNAKVSGTVAAPQGVFDMKVSGASLDALGSQGVAAFDAAASGTLAGKTVKLTFKASSATALSLTGGGTVDLGQPSRLDMSVKGRAGSKLFSDRLAESGLRAQGDISFDLRLTGALAAPEVNGTADISNGTIGDAAGQFVVRNVKGRLELRNRELHIVSLTGATGRKGTASATGSLSLDGDMRIDMQAKVADGNYSDGSFVTARYDADLTLTGALATGLLLKGDVGLRDTKITLSELPRRAVSPLDVKHLHAPPAVKRQAAELHRRLSGSSAKLSLDINLKVRDSVSVSGRGLNVVLNGGLRLYGSTGDLAAEGALQMYRGTLTLPARSLDFERGSLTFDRNFDPLINFVAVSQRSDSTITLTVSGRASEPSITVTSQPELPPEEAMARLIFDNSMLQLSPLQLAQIASYVATLTGGGGSGLLGGLQSALGVDWLTVRQTETGDTEVGAAKRLNDRLSVGVEQTTNANNTRVIIDLSATRNLKFRGTVDSDQSTSLGVYFQKDY